MNERTATNFAMARKAYEELGKDGVNHYLIVVDLKDQTSEVYGPSTILQCKKKGAEILEKWSAVQESFDDFELHDKVSDSAFCIAVVKPIDL